MPDVEDNYAVVF